MRPRTGGVLSAERALYLRQNRRRLWAIRLWRWGCLLTLLLAWEVAARLSWIDSFIFSRPSRIAQTYVTMMQGDLWYHVRVTVTETLAGFLLGAVAGVLLAQVLENIGMCLAMLPVVGITLPFMSYGGSSMLTNYALLALVHSVHANRNKYYFERESS